MTARRVVVARRPAEVGRVGVVDPSGTARDAETRAVMRRQLSRAVVTVGLCLATLLGVPVLAGGVADLRWWAALSVGVQPVWVLLAVHHLKDAERAERAGP